MPMQPYVTPSNQPVMQWRPVEVCLEGSVAREDPFAEIEVDVDFVSPSGETRRCPAFWDGGNVWKARFAPDSTGAWAWRSVCTDAADAGLNGIEGTVECVPNTGGTSTDRHGFLRARPGARYFSHADGTPFFWLGDTHWLMPDTERIDTCNHPGHGGAPCPYGGQFQHLAAARREQGFTVYQLYPEFARPHWWRGGVGPAAGGRLDPARFRDVFDFEMDHLASLGFVMAVGLGHFTNSVRAPEASLRRWARYVTARYGAYPVVWITCQEMNCPSDLGGTLSNDQSVWERVAVEIDRANVHRHPHSAHQWVVDPDVRPVWHAPWHTWFALQGGHRGSGFTPLSRYRAYRECAPVRPVLETEAMYEKVDCGGVADTADAVGSAWRAMLSGCSGYTYGAAGIWALKFDPSDDPWKDYNHEVSAWHEGLELSGARQLAVWRKFFEELPWTKVEPRFDDPEWCRWTDPEKCATATIGGNARYLVFFHADAGAVSPGELRGLREGCAYAAKWMRVSDGLVKDAGILRPAAGGVLAVPPPPGAGWLLDLARAD